MWAEDTNGWDSRLWIYRYSENGVFLLFDHDRSITQLVNNMQETPWEAYIGVQSVSQSQAEAVSWDKHPGMVGPRFADKQQVTNEKGIGKALLRRIAI